MLSPSISYLKNIVSNKSALWVSMLFTLSLFIIVLFAIGVPQDIETGVNGQIAIKELDGMNHPLMKIKAATSRFHIDENVAAAKSDLEKLGESAESCIHHYESAASYNSVLSNNVAAFTLAYNKWIDAENEYLNLYSQRLSWRHDHVDHHHLTQMASENNSLFLSTMQLLFDGEPPIHDDIAKGRRASQILQWASALLIIYFFFVVAFYQRRSNRAHAVREANLEVTLRSIGDAVIATDILGNVTCMSPEAERLTGWNFEDAKGRALSEVFRVVNEHSGEPVNDLVEQVRRENSIVVMTEDSMLIASDGSCYQIYENGAPIYGDTGILVGVLLVFRDITHSRKLKSRLSDNAQRLQRVIDTSMDAVIVIDEQGMVDEWNPAAELMFGWSNEEIRKQPIHEAIIPEEFREQHLLGVKHLINNNQATTHAKRIESTGLYRDGHTFPIELAMTSIRTEKGWVFNAFIRDLSAQKHKEHLLKKNDVLLHESQRMAKLGYWELNHVNGNLDWSDETYKTFCIDPATNKPSYDLFLNVIHVEDKERVNKAFAESVRNKTPYDIVFKIVANDKIRVVHAKCETSYDDDGNPLRSIGLQQDITELQEKDQKLLMQDVLLRETQRIAKLGYWELDLVGDTLVWSDEIYRIFCLDPASSEPSYELFINKIHPEDRERVDVAFSESLKNKTPYNIIHRIVTDEGVKIVHEQCETSYDGDGNPLRALGLVQDITERVNNLDELRLAATMFKAHAGILITETDGTILRVNPAFEEMTGYSSSELVGNNPRMLQSGKQSKEFYNKIWGKVAKDGTWQGELWNKRKDGALYAEWLTLTAVNDDVGEVTHYVGTSQDITERKEAESQIEYLAYHDDLTDLANRRLLHDRLRQNIASCKRHNEFGAVLLLDLDRFKDLNDSLGHSVGDEILRQVASRLKEIVREDDTVARLGGDEFVVVLSSVGNDISTIGVKVQAIAEKIRISLLQPYKQKNGQCYSTVSIGISLFPEKTENIDDIIKHADTALYRAKAQGRNTSCFYKPSMQIEVDAKLAIGDGLRKALENKEFILYYQPQVNDRHELLGAEALIRWQHPEQGMIPPDRFIPVAEDTGLILDIGLWVLQEAARQVAEWHAAGICKQDMLRLSVNVSPRQFRQPDFAAQVLSVFEHAGVSPDCIELEVTESMLMDDLDDIVKKMKELRRHGIRISIDDFGTGYSSLAYLKQLPLDQLKIDQSFIRDITSDDNDGVVVETIIAMASHLGLGVIAEGVENQRQLDFLIEKGCKAFQGYYFSQALSVDDFERYIREQDNNTLQDRVS